MSVITCPRCGGIGGFYEDSALCSTCRAEDRENAVTIPKSRLEALEEVALTARLLLGEMPDDKVGFTTYFIMLSRRLESRLGALGKEEKQG